MIYILSLAFSMGVSTFVKYDGGIGGFSVVFAVGAAVLLAGLLVVRLLASKKYISLAAHLVVLVILWFIPMGESKINIDHIMLLVFTIILTVVNTSEFEKKKNSAYGEINVFSCICFVIIYAVTAYYEEKGLYGSAGVFSVVICFLCIFFFALTLVRSYLSNAMKLVDNSHMDEDAPVSYMYGNSNKFIGPIIVLIVATMLVIQSRTSANILGKAWMSLLSGVAAICNSILFLNSDAAQIDNVTKIAAKGTTQYITEVVIAAIIVVIIIVLLGLLISKIYKSHWRKDESADETLESAAMVEKREWIYHKESKRKSEDTSVTKAAEIPTEIPKRDDLNGF